MTVYRVRKGWFDRCVMQRQEGGQWVDVQYGTINGLSTGFEPLPPGAHARILKAEKRAAAQKTARALKAQRAA